VRPPLARATVSVNRVLRPKRDEVSDQDVSAYTRLHCSHHVLCYHPHTTHLAAVHTTIGTSHSALRSQDPNTSRYALLYIPALSTSLHSALCTLHFALYTRHSQTWVVCTLRTAQCWAVVGTPSAACVHDIKQEAARRIAEAETDARFPSPCRGRE
jgi:hypothetical protein